MNFGRPQFVRDPMVANGDAHKPIWISETGWNTVPADARDKPWAQMTPEQPARYMPLAYQRIRREWPWLGGPTLVFQTRHRRVAACGQAGSLFPACRSRISTCSRPITA